MNSIAILLFVSAALAVVSAGGRCGGSFPALPCPANYLFSCQPNLAPVPCVPPEYTSTGYGWAGYGSAGYGSAGAYSENVPTILNAAYGYQGLPQQLNQFPNYYGHTNGGN